LREGSDEGAELAELLTDTFPNEDRSAPYYAELASIGDTPAWIVLELWGSEDGSLDRTRLWILERGSGRVIHATAFN
jgi:hypothetical protein